MFGNEKAATWCRENGILVQRALSEGVNSAGGVLVPEEMQNEIIVLRNSYGLARRDLKRRSDGPGHHDDAEAGLRPHHVLHR
jgi:HK97 family phage major capsid protein